jgi:formylglycine-generating enzyme required for sulfatase activity/WD40 repeat protein
MRHIIFVFVLIAWMPFWAGILPESDAGGQVKEIQGETIRFLADSEFQPVAGDRIEIYVEVPGVGPAVVATAVVTGVEGDHVLAKVERTIGKISAGQKIRAAASGSPITPPKSDVRRTPERVVDQPSFAVVPFSTEEATRFRDSWAAYLGVPAVKKSQLGMQLKLIPPGEFTMGSPESLPKYPGWMADPETQHQVRLTRPFYIGAHEVSLAAFRAFVDETDYETDAEKKSEGDWAMNPKTRKFEKDLGFTWKKPGFEQSDEHPVVCVSWHDARAFCRWISRKEGATYRLPTEAEWEYACRAGTTTCFWAGEALSSLQANGSGTKAYNDAKPGPNRLGTVPLEAFEANAFGLYEVHGNVWEWCSDWYAPYDKGPAVDPIGAESGELRVMRGGGWNNGMYYLRSALRLRFTPTTRSNNVGFRIVQEISSAIPSRAESSPPGTLDRDDKVVSPGAPPLPAAAAGFRELRVLRGHRGSAFMVAVTPDGGRVLTTGIDGTLRTWDLATGKERSRIQAHKDWAVGVAVSPDGKRAVTSGNDKTVRLWDLETGKELRRFEGHTNFVWSVMFSSDGQRVLSGSHDKTVRLWDAETGKEVRRFEGGDKQIWGACLSPDGTRVLSADVGGGVHLWDVETGRELRAMQGHTGAITAAFSPDGQRALSGGTQGKEGLLLLWDLKTGKQLRRFEGHKKIVRITAVSPDGQRAATTSYDKTVRLWDLETGRELARFDWPIEVEPSGLFGVAFTCDGRQIVAAGSDGLVRVLEINL